MIGFERFLHPDPLERELHFLDYLDSPDTCLHTPCHPHSPAFEHTTRLKLHILGNGPLFSFWRTSANLWRSLRPPLLLPLGQ
jgi:hypothetical protein